MIYFNQYYELLLLRLKTYLLVFACLFFCIKTTTSQVIINEVGIAPNTFSTSCFLSSNTDGGQGGEFLELYNVGTSSVNIGCFVVMFVGTSGGGNPTGWTIAIPSGTTLGPNSYYLIAGGGTNAGGSTSNIWSNTNIGGTLFINTFGSNTSSCPVLQVNSTNNSNLKSIIS